LALGSWAILITNPITIYFSPLEWPYMHLVLGLPAWAQLFLALSSLISSTSTPSSLSMISSH
jgi:hypothetical protein